MNTAVEIAATVWLGIPCFIVFLTFFFQIDWSK